MSPRLTDTENEVWRFADLLFGSRPGLRPLLDRARSENPDHASSAIARLERQCDPALAAIAWSFFWIRHADFFQARRELETIANSDKAQSFWGGMAVLALGEICLEQGETEQGLALLRRAEQILGEPP